VHHNKIDRRMAEMGSDSVILRCRLNVRITFESGRRGEIGARLQRAIAVIVAIRLTERHGMSGGITPA
jgi:hypothetical protein